MLVTKFQFKVQKYEKNWKTKNDHETPLRAIFMVLWEIWAFPKLKIWLMTKPWKIFFLTWKDQKNLTFKIDVLTRLRALDPNLWVFSIVFLFTELAQIKSLFSLFGIQHTLASAKGRSCMDGWVGVSNKNGPTIFHPKIYWIARCVHSKYGLYNRLRPVDKKLRRYEHFKLKTRKCQADYVGRK